MTLSPIDEQSGNGDACKEIAIWKTKKEKASNNAAQTIAVGEEPVAGGTRIGGAGTGATGTIRMMYATELTDEKKAPDQPGP